MDDLANLEYLGLVSKISSEIENHLGVSDKTLAEFVINTHGEAKNLSDFEAQLKEVGAEFPQSLVESIDRLILTLHPKHKKKPNQAPVERDGRDEDEEKSRKARVFRGLAIPDAEPDAKERDDSPPPLGNALDDTFAALEQMAAPAKRHRSRSPQRTSRSGNKTYDFDFGDENRRKCRNRSKESRRHKRDRSDSPNGWGRKKVREDRDDFRRPPTPELDDEPIQFKVYDGRVTGVKDFGAFVELDGLKGKRSGLVHVSKIQEGARVSHPSDLLNRNQLVKVKILNIEGARLSLSMKDVDQETGRDLAPAARIGSGANSQALGSTDIVPVFETNYNSQNGSRKRMTSPERWEIQQLVASGVLPRSALPEIDESYNAHIKGEAAYEEEEEVDIELTEIEPAFLAGQTAKSLELSPIRVVKNPDSSLARAATQGAVLAQERRELRQQDAQEKASKEAEKVDLSSQWNDPMAQKRQFASEVRNTHGNQPSEALPEWKKIATYNKDASFGKRTTLSMKEQREGLPVFKFRSQILDAVRDNQVLVLVGETGSGKTTQIVQYLAEAGYASNGKIIGCTQPRRVAAMSVAKRVAEEVGCSLGQEVGYTIRFEDCTSPDTKIKFMTDGILQRECLVADNVSAYSCLILDEAHERTIATDVLMGLLTKIMKQRPDLKIIVTSATMNAERFSTFFNGCPIFSIPGRMFPVEIMYAREPCDDYVEEALQTVMTIHLTEDAGDILLFLTGKEEIDTSCEILDQRMKALGPEVPELIILPIYSALPQETASKIFEPAPPGSRKVVIATNIAETSLTIDGIVYVVDPGMSKQSTYSSELGMDRLQVMPISQAQAKQRSGRAGRTGPGKAFRLYTESAFTGEMMAEAIPDIQRANVSSTVLLLKALGVNDLLRFPFLDPPPTATLLSALEELYNLGALDEEGLLTRLGRRCADMPMDPPLAKTLIKSAEMHCSSEILTIVSMISATVNGVFHRPREKQAQADARKKKFHDQHGDHLTLLNVYRGWEENGFATPWCLENYIQPKAMKRVAEVRKQLLVVMQRHKLPIVSCGRDTTPVRKAIVQGYFRNSARRDPSEGYKTLVEGTPVYMHPSSALFGKNSEVVCYHSLVETSREYMTHVSVIEPKWLVEAAPTFFRVAPTDRLSKRKKAERIQPLHNKFAGEDDWRLSAQKRAGRGGGGTWG